MSRNDATRSSYRWTRPRGRHEGREGHVRYLLLIYGDETARPELSPEEQASEMKVWGEYTDWLREKGWYEAGEALQYSSTATVVRQREGATLTTDGPFAETKEQLGGYYLVSCENLDEAIEAASRIPTVARGEPVEVRPIQEFPEQPS
jgi:hypothetical protein